MAMTFARVHLGLLPVEKGREVKGEFRSIRYNGLGWMGEEEEEK